MSSQQAVNEVCAFSLVICEFSVSNNTHFALPIIGFATRDLQFLQAELTLHTDEIGDNIQIPVIVNTLNRSLGDLVPLVHDEAVLAFDEAFPFDDSEGKSEDGE